MRAGHHPGGGRGQAGPVGPGGLPPTSRDGPGCPVDRGARTGPAGPGRPGPGGGRAGRRFRPGPGGPGLPGRAGASRRGGLRRAGHGSGAAPARRPRVPGPQPAFRPGASGGRVPGPDSGSHAAHPVAERTGRGGVRGRRRRPDDLRLRGGHAPVAGGLRTLVPRLGPPFARGELPVPAGRRGRHLEPAQPQRPPGGQGHPGRSGCVGGTRYRPARPGPGGPGRPPGGGADRGGDCAEPHRGTEPGQRLSGAGAGAAGPSRGGGRFGGRPPVSTAGRSARGAGVAGAGHGPGRGRAPGGAAGGRPPTEAGDEQWPAGAAQPAPKDGFTRRPAVVARRQGQRSRRREGGPIRPRRGPGPAGRRAQHGPHPRCGPPPRRRRRPGRQRVGAGRVEPRRHRRPRRRSGVTVGAGRAGTRPRALPGLAGGADRDDPRSSRGDPGFHPRGEGAGMAPRGAAPRHRRSAPPPAFGG